MPFIQGKPASALLVPSAQTSQIGAIKNLVTRAADYTSPTQSATDFETAVAVRVNTVDVYDIAAVTGRYLALEKASIAEHGKPVKSAFAQCIALIAKKAGDPSSPGSSLPARLRPRHRAQVLPQRVAADAHLPIGAAGRAFVAAIAQPLKTLDDFVALQQALLESSIFSHEEAEGYAQLLLPAKSQMALDAMINLIRVTNGHDLETLYAIVPVKKIEESQQRDSGEISTVPNAAFILLHEYAHHMLAANPVLLAGTVALQRERMGLPLTAKAGDFPVYMSTPAAPKPDYVYQQRMYRGNEDRSQDSEAFTNTELLPVALQHFATPAAMQHLHDVDPELFFFALGAVRPDVPSP